MSICRVSGLGVAPLSALDLSVLAFVRAAADADFDAVGLRVQGVSDSDPPFPSDLSSVEFRELEAILSGSGLEVLDLEVLTITPGVSRSDWLRLMEIGARLGASFINVVGSHPSLSEFESLIGQLTLDAHDHGLEPLLEPIAYRALNSFVRAVEIAKSVGCSVELDVLHFLRTGADLKVVEENADMFPVLQICDAPLVISSHGYALDSIAKELKLPLEVTESRMLRLFPGEGDAPIKDLVSILGDRTRISVEIPNFLVRRGQQAPNYLAQLRGHVNGYLAEVS